MLTKFSAALYIFENTMGFLGFVSRIIAISLVMYLSLAKVPQSFMKTFTLNLFAFYIPYAVVASGQYVISIGALYVAPMNQLRFLFHCFCQQIFFHRIHFWQHGVFRSFRSSFKSTHRLFTELPIRENRSIEYHALFSTCHCTQDKTQKLKYNSPGIARDDYAFPFRSKFKDLVTVLAFLEQFNSFRVFLKHIALTIY